MKIKSQLISIRNIIIFLLFRKRQIKNFLEKQESMSGNAVHKLMAKYSKNKNVLEFGAGSSTIALSKIAKRLVSVESDKMLIRELDKRINDAHVFIHFANIGPVSSFGTPISIFKLRFQSNYRNYHAKIFELDIKNTQFDVVIIDGRFRVSCFLNSLNHIAPPFIIIFDDYFSRWEYQIIESFNLDLLERVDDCAVFYVKKDYRNKISNELINEYKFVTS